MAKAPSPKPRSDGIFVFDDDIEDDEVDQALPSLQQSKLSSNEHQSAGESSNSDNDDFDAPEAQDEERTANDKGKELNKNGKLFVPLDPADDPNTEQRDDPCVACIVSYCAHKSNGACYMDKRKVSGRCLWCSNGHSCYDM